MLISAWLEPASPTIVIAPNGHNSTQTSQAPQITSSVRATIGSISTWPLAIGIAALDAAAEPCATESGISLGPWATPAM